MGQVGLRYNDGGGKKTMTLVHVQHACIWGSQTSLLKCCDFNYKGQCSKFHCQYEHECTMCSLNHPYLRHNTSSGSSLNFKSDGGQTALRPQLPRRHSVPSAASHAFYSPSYRPISKIAASELSWLEFKN